jgi:signal transduction histidine kinase
LPILEEEIRQIGIHSGKTLAAEIMSGRMLSLPNPGHAIENSLQEVLYTQPDIARIDVIVKDSLTGALKLVATNIDEEPGASPVSLVLVDAVTSEYKVDESGFGSWEINVPMEHRSRDSRGPKRVMGTVHVVVSTKLVGRMMHTLWKTTATAAAFSVVALIWALRYFLRKTIANDRLLKQAESENFYLTEQLHEAERQLMTNEKFAVMGQLTASFAHEIGTPLNAIGGHLQLLKEEVGPGKLASMDRRFEIVNGQLKKIEGIVKGFLQSTSKPPSQKQLVDINLLLEKTVGIVMPRLNALQTDLKLKFNRNLAPLRAVPLDLEQIFLNFLNNSLDSISAKALNSGQPSRYQLEIVSDLVVFSGKQWARVSVYDTGGGIRKGDLKNVLKPFFTTKRPGEGTGLGLTICQQLAQKYGGRLEIESKEGVWARVGLLLPYHANT